MKSTFLDLKNEKLKNYVFYVYNYNAPVNCTPFVNCDGFRAFLNVKILFKMIPEKHFLIIWAVFPANWLLHQKIGKMALLKGKFF